ncbi:hypothetical protein [Pseudomonas pseudonitroreducens]|uniref:hypothetical protein n=1 Tax=Pseudomonas pseudonitroreducens TaxID=2892326 RepID=UPI001F16EFDF|nr:hypothetical protein [Pseudomonas pseudonitroreducens]
MKTLNDVLRAGNLFTVDPLACMAHAEIIKKYKSEKKTEIWGNHPPELLLAFKIFFISICHQINWDFLQESIFKNTLGKNLDLIETLKNIDSKTLNSWLIDYPKKDRIKAKERALILRETARTIIEKFDSNPKKLYSAAKNSTLGGKAFEELMNSFTAYQKDPLKKKTNVLTHDLTTEGIIHFEDEENLEPAVDYHIMRTYLRTGRVIPVDQALFKFFKGTPNPRNYITTKLRETVTEAVKLTSHYSRINIAEINYIEWQIGRSACTNKEPICHFHRNSNLPPAIEALSPHPCPYMDSCLAFNTMEEFIEFEEPIFISSHY